MSREYVTALKDSLDKKLRVLEETFRLCQLQSDILGTEPVDYDAFDRLFDDKDICIQKIAKLDEGFETVYSRVKEELDSNRNSYSSDIAKMQDTIQKITDIGTRITALEERNKAKVTESINKDRRKMSEGKRSVNVAMNYYKNMSGQQMGESRYMDQKN